MHALQSNRLVSIVMVPAVDTRPMKDDVSMDPIAPKSELAQDGHVSMSSSVSTPEPEEQTQDVAQTQKRKGGRKPVCLPLSCFPSSSPNSNTKSRSMPLPKSGNREIGRLRPHFAKGEPSISNNWKQRSSGTKSLSNRCSKATGALPTSVLCCDTRIPYSRGF